MKISINAFCFAGAILAFPSGVSAAVLVQDNFDGYADQAAFVAAWPQVGATASGTLSTTNPSSSPNSINYATTTQRNEKVFSESGTVSSTNVLIFSFDFFDSNAALNPYRQFANLQDSLAPASSGQLVSMGLNNNQVSTDSGGNYYMGRILGYTPTGDAGAASGSYFKLNLPGAPLRSTGWHNLSVAISDVDFKFYVDGILSEVVPQGAFALRSYDVVRLGSGLTATASANFDNVSITTVVPEPMGGGLALAGIGLLAVGRRRPGCPT